MSSSRTIWVAALVALLVSALAPQADAVWQCEGRTCGTTPWYCCCVSPVDAKDAHCRASAQPASGGSACPADCGCTLTVREGQTPLLAAASRFRVYAVLAVPLFRASVNVAPLPAEIIGRSIETRGPPLPRVSLSVPSLRAPPAA